ncbi:TetR/AcrR family transcriptional regulator [Streptomyces sp. WZ-12]|uniref:TetR/AcrR family transcriptional regulator n=1 Tax=Streptomyces sp. WZ-12 TaxID=3030210 RepID=UPI0023814C56|nr:TetR family transcriptional regulator [Streptomyces sp. WZ-12]
MGAEAGTEKGTTQRRAQGARERILTAAARLFAEQGITATGMEQVATEAPVSKRTLYLHFRTKSDLVLAHLRALAESGSTLEGVLTLEDLDPRERILRLFDPPAADAAVARGCPFIDAAAEFPDPESPIHAYAREQKLLMVRLLAALVRELGCEEPDALAEQLVTLADGAASRAMVLNEADYGRHARAAAKTLLAHALPGTA